jgi:Mn-containing catalase
MFEAALATFQPNFPPGVRQADPRYSNVYFNMSKGAEARGPWNEGSSAQLGEPWKYVADPQSQVEQTNGLVDTVTDDTTKTSQNLKEMEADLSEKKVKEIKSATPEKDIQWSEYKGKSKGEK